MTYFFFTLIPILFNSSSHLTLKSKIITYRSRHFFKITFGIGISYWNNWKCFPKISNTSICVHFSWWPFCHQICAMIRFERKFAFSWCNFHRKLFAISSSDTICCGFAIKLCSKILLMSAFKCDFFFSNKSYIPNFPIPDFTFISTKASIRFRTNVFSMVGSNCYFATWVRLIPIVFAAK